MRKLTAAGSALALALAVAAPAQAAISDNVVKIGVLTDMAGVYSGMGGAGSVVAAQMAVEDCLKAECKGLKIEVISADHQNKADIAVAKAREWLQREKVDAFADLTNSAASLAVQNLIREQGGIAMYSGPATSRLTNDECAVNGFHWMFDTYSQAVGSAAALTKLGHESWYFLTVDYAFGHSLEQEASAVVKANGGTVVGAVRHPLGSQDFSSYLLQAAASDAQVIGLASAGSDSITAVKHAREFGVGGDDQKLAALLLFLSEVHAIGLEAAQGLIFADGFYWDFDDASRAFAARFEKRHAGNKPTMVQAGVYSSVYHYLKSVAAAKTDDWKVVAQTMRELPIEDPVMHNASIRPDGRVIHDMYLYEVKSPAESKAPWDYQKLLATIPADQAFTPLADSKCTLVNK